MKMNDNPLHLVLLTGMSGSGKSVALHALEDLGFFCVDNLPPELLTDLVHLERTGFTSQLAIAMDVRSASALPLVPQQLHAFKTQDIQVDSVFLDASTDMLIRRYSETRRRHPLSTIANNTVEPDQRRALAEAIELERTLLQDLRTNALVIDTSLIRPTQLQSYLKDLISAPNSQMTLVFESFAFKRGIPNDADFVFDVRMLPNPHYEPTLKSLTGQDAQVIEFLAQEPDVLRMQRHIQDFLNHWLDALAHNHRSYVTVAVGCTGGQHRSVYLVEQLTKLFSSQWHTLKRHREMDAR